MFKLALIDDEERVCRGIQNSVDWSLHEIEVVGSAHDGLSGLKLIEETQPDVIITDVYMPGCDGLEVVRRTAERLPHAKSVILSGYENFSYVQAAMRYGAFDYVLKPARIEELLRIVNNAVEKIKEERNQDQQKHQLQHLLHRNMPVVKEKLLLDMLNGAIKPHSYLEKIGTWGAAIDRSTATAVVLEIGEDEVEGRGDHHTLLFALNNIAEEIAAKELYAETAQQAYPHRVILLVYGSKIPTGGALTERIALSVRLIQHTMHKFYRLTVSAGIGSSKAFQEAVESYEEALQALDCRLFLGEGKVTSMEDMDRLRKQVGQGSYPLPIEESAAMAIKLRNREEAVDRAHDFVTYMLKHYLPDSDTFRKMCLLFIWNLIRKFVEWEMNVNVPEEIKRLEKEIRSVKSLEQMKSLLGSKFHGWIDRMEEQDQQGNAPAVEKALKYIEANFDRDLSVHEVSSRVYLTPNYLSTLFHRSTGKTILEYVTELRINKAKSLLKQSDLNNIEIAQTIGYVDAKYFGQIFKKTTGMTPGEYRKSQDR